MKILIVLACVLSAATAQIVVAGRCKDTPVVQNFDVPAYAGLWYEMYRYEHFDQYSGDCSTAKYELKNGVVEVTNAMVLNGKLYDIMGTAALENATSGEAKLLVNFAEGSGKGKYWVLATDYTSYSLVYACTDLENNNKKVSTWILSRTKTLSPQAVVEIHPYIDARLGLNWDNYRQTSQSESSCNYETESSNRSHHPRFYNL